MATKVIEAFKLLDDSNENIISGKALQEIHKNLRDTMAQEEIDKLVKDIDFNEDGVIDLSQSE